MTDVWSVALVAMVLTQASVVATSVYLHGTLAHRALAVHWVADLLFRTISGSQRANAARSGKKPGQDTPASPGRTAARRRRRRGR